MRTSPGELLLRAPVADDADVLALRRTAREVAARLGLESQDQVRVATALSEVGRSAAAAGGGTATMAVQRQGGACALVITVATAEPLPADGGAAGGGVPAARRLLDRVEVRDAPAEVVLTKALRAPVTTAVLDDVRAALAGTGAPTGLEEMRVHNAELIGMLEELTESSRALEQANAELEETNRGVLAMYTQLSDELEETNSGVVALYAELDERGRQLSAANEAKTRFLRNVSHELRTPVNSILGLVSLLAESALDDEQRRQVSYLQDSADALLGLVNELLDLARAESGRQEVHATTVGLADLLEELRGTTAPLVRDGVRLEIPAPGVAEVSTDRRLLARVLRNLLTNAAKFTDTGHVRLTVAAEAGEPGDGAPADGWLRFDVEDTGLGIDAEHVERVFEEFYQIPNRLQPTVRGTGLGLPYARRTMESLGGSLDAASTPGRGSVFTARLPLAAAPAAPAPDGGLAGLRVLVADDDASYRAVLRDMLRGAVASVAEAGTVAAAAAAVRDGAPDAVLLDVRMPDADGLAGLDELRAVRPGLPVVLMSSAAPPALPDPPEGTDATVPFLAKSAADRAMVLAALRAACGPGDDVANDEEARP